MSTVSEHPRVHTGLLPKGKTPLFWQHPQALVETDHIGGGTRVWAFAHVLEGASIGAFCNICDHTFVEGGVRIGDRVTVKCGVQLWDGVVLENDVFVGPNVTFTNDPFPRSRGPGHPYARTTVREGASIGANATILPGITIGAGAMVGAGAVVTRDVPRHAIVRGNPARVTGSIDQVRETSANLLNPPRPIASPPESDDQRKASLIELPRVVDHRGSLSFAEVETFLPFPVLRYFLIFGVPNSEIRGEHAHRALQQFLVCVNGSCSVRLFDGDSTEEVLLNRPDLGLYLPPLIWSTQFNYSPDAVLLVLASDVYRDDDYIRELELYLALIKPHLVQAAQS